MSLIVRWAGAGGRLGEQQLTAAAGRPNRVLRGPLRHLIKVGRADDPASAAVGLGGGALAGDRIADVDGAGMDDPSVKGEFAAEPVRDAAEHVEVLLAGIGVDGGDYAALRSASEARTGRTVSSGTSQVHGQDGVASVHSPVSEQGGSGLVTWWLARAEAQLPPAGDWLTPTERGRAEGLRYAKRRNDFLLSRWALKVAVARVSGWPDLPATLARIEGRSAPDGAPELYVDGQPDPRGISLTDRAGCAVSLVAARSAAIGCDLELVEPRSDAFVRDYLTEPERQWVEMAGTARDVAPNLMWSAKESALKVLRTGLRRDTRSVEVTVADARPPERTWSRFQVRSAEGAVFDGWWQRSGAYLLTVCWAGGGPPPTALEDASPLDTEPPSHRWLERPVT